MYQYLPIRDVYAREILDSRGNPTLEVEVLAGENIVGRASVPSGASTGQYEALELRDGGERFAGKGVLDAVDNVNSILAGEVIGVNVFHQSEIDRMLVKADGTDDKSNLGANAVLGVSLATAHAAAKALRLPLFRYLGGIYANTMPVPMMNILNGGAHSKNSIDFQEFMIMPVGACCFKEALRMGTEVYYCLKKVLDHKGLSTAVGDEGGFAPDVDGVEEVLDLLVEAVKNAGYECGKDICFALDVAASEWKSEKGKGCYHLPKSGADYNSDELIDMYKNMVTKYPIISIEDPLDEEDWNGWKKITAELGDKIQLVGDDLFVTNTERLSKGIHEGCGNSILIKLNQIGSLSETLEVIKLAHKSGYTAVVSHRSGETEDTTIADLAVALNTGQIKTGAPCRSERVAKYNRLLRMEEELGESAVYPGMKTFFHEPIVMSP